MKVISFEKQEMNHKSPGEKKRREGTANLTDMSAVVHLSFLVEPQNGNDKFLSADSEWVKMILSLLTIR